MLNLHGGSKSRLAASGADFSASEDVYSLFETRLAVILAQPANSAFSLYSTAITMDYHIYTDPRDTGHPVRSAIHKLEIGRSVVGWVTTSESLLLYVFWVSFLPTE